MTDALTNVGIFAVGIVVWWYGAALVSQVWALTIQVSRVADELERRNETD